MAAIVLSDAPPMPQRDNAAFSDGTAAAAGLQPNTVDIAEPLLVKAFTAAKRRASVLEHKEAPLADPLADSSSSLLAADAELPAKRPMLQHTRSPPLATRTLFHAAASHAQLVGDFVPVRPVDSARFEEAHSFPVKHVTHQPAATDSSFVGTPQLQLDGVSLVPFIPPALPAAPLPHASATAVRPRFKLKPPPTPQPSMCIPARERVEELFGNMLLRRRGQEVPDAAAPLVDDDADSVGDDAAGTPCLDIHASPAFTSTRTYSSQDPFGHTQARNGGPFIFERDFCEHKNVGAGAFFEVFRVEAAEPTPTSNVDHTRQQRQFEQFSMELDRRDAHSRRPSLAVNTAAKPRSNRRVYAIKKSLRPFRSEYDRACLLRETNILALINQSLIEPPPSVVAKFAAASAAAATRPDATAPSSAAPAAVAPVAHRNPFLLKWYQTWQESGFFFEQIEYCTCNLAELIFVLMETPPTPPTKAASTASSSPPSSPSSEPQSYFHQHLPRLFLSLLTQITLALHTLHTQAGGGIVHLDIKPDNILLNRRGKKVLLSDYGFAKQLSELQRDADTTNPGRRGSNEEIEGDSVYMAPELLDDPDDDDSDDEQMNASAPERQSSTDSSASASTHPRSRATGPTTKCDLFSLGLLLFEMVSNSELPPSGFLWQQLRQGAVTTYLPLFEEAAALDASLSDAPLSSPVVSQSHLGRDVHTSEVQQNGITAWMVSIIENLLSPVPSARMSASELLVAIERKLLLLGWIDATAEDSTRSQDAETRASELAFAWTSVLPPCLALPDVASLNFSALIQRAQEMELPPATPTPLAGAAMQFAFADAASPCFVRQRSSPSPSRSGSGFFAGAKLGPRISPVPFAAPISASTLNATQPLSATHTRLGVTPLRHRHPKMMHSRSVSVGVGSIEAMLTAAPAPGHTLTVPENCATPSLLRRSIVPRSPSARDLSSAAELSNLSPPKSRSAHGPAPGVAASSSSGSTRVSLAASALPPIQVPSISRLERFQPLSPFKLNSPARKTSAGFTQVACNASSHKSHHAMAQAAEAEITRAATIAHTTSPSSVPIAASLSPPQPSSSHSAAVPAHSRALFQSASPYLDGGLPTPPLRPRTGSIFGSLVSAAASNNPQHQPQSIDHPLSPPMLLSQSSGSMLLAPSSSASSASAAAASSSAASSCSSTGSMFGSPRVSSSSSHHGLSMFGHARTEHHHAMMTLAASVVPAAASVASPIFMHLQQCNNTSRSDITVATPPTAQ